MSNMGVGTGGTPYRWPCGRVTDIVHGPNMRETRRLIFHLWPWAFYMKSGVPFDRSASCMGHSMPFMPFFLLFKNHGGATLRYTLAWRCVAGVHTALRNVAEITCHEVKDIRNKDEVAKCLKTVLSSKMVR
jgi:hypothetical protein